MKRVWVLLLLAGCAKSPSLDDKLQMLDAQERAQKADLIKARAQCLADSAEFGVADVATRSCWASYAVLVRSSVMVQQAIDDRRREIEPPGRVGRFVPDAP